MIPCINSDPQTFSSAQEFLAYCQEFNKTYIVPGACSEAWIALHQKQQAELRIEKLDVRLFYNTYFQDLLEMLLVSVGNESLKSAAAEYVAVGFLESDKLQPEIHRSGNGRFYSILIPSAFMSLLNRYLKLVASALNPDDVIYCNGRDVSQLGKSDYIKMSTSMLVHFGEYQEVKGAEIKLEIGSRALAFVDRCHHYIISFILGHELAHFINDDLSESPHPRKFNLVAESGLAGINRFHTEEFKADIIGFELLLRMVHAESSQATVVNTLRWSIVLLFNMVREIQDLPTELYPMSSTRICAIIDCFLGEPAANLMFASFNDLSLIPIYEKKYGGITIAEVLTDLAK